MSNTLSTPAIPNTSPADRASSPVRRQSREIAIPNVLVGPLLASIILLAFALRIYGGVTWGLPDRFHPDEPAIIDRAVEIVSTGDPNPRWFQYPSLYIYIQAAAEPLGRPFQGIIDSKYDGDTALLIQARQLAVGRTISVLFGTLAVAGAYLLGRRGYGVAAGLAGAAILAFHWPHVANSQWLTTDVPASAAVALAAFCSVAALKERSLRWILVASVAAGLAAGLKYNAGIAVVMPVVASLLLWRRYELVRNLSIIPVTALLAFLVVTPFALLDFQHFWADLQLEMDHYSTGHAGADGGSTWLFYASTLLFEAPFTGCLMGAGVIYALVKRHRVDLILLSFVGFYYVLIGAQEVHFGRNLMPLVPVTAVLAGRLVCEITAWASTTPALPRSAGSIAAIVFVALLGLASSEAFANSRLLTTADSRHVARDWMIANLPAGARVTEESYAPRLDDVFLVRAQQGLYEVPYEGLLCQSDYVVASSARFDRYVTGANTYPERRQLYEQVFQLPLVQEVSPQAGTSDAGPRIFIYSVPAAACQLPQAVSVTPANQTVAAGATTTLTATFRHAGGRQNLKRNDLVVGSTGSRGDENCWLIYRSDQDRLYLLTIDGTYLDAGRPGQAMQTSDEHCTLDAAATTVTSTDTDSIVNFAVTFKPEFAGQYNLHMRSEDQGGNRTGIDNGDITIE